MRRRTTLFALAGVPLISTAQQPPTDIDDSATNLMVVLRESIGSKSIPRETMEFIGRFKVALQDGKQADAEVAHYAYLGDMHIRFVFDGERTMRHATLADLKRLNLSPEKALELAMTNLRRVHGAPWLAPNLAGTAEVLNRSHTLMSSYFLDKAFWREIEAKHPQGLVAAVPQRDSLLFAPAADSDAVDALSRGVEYLHSSNGHWRVSSGLYLFKGGAWTVFQEPVATLR